jgi:hypothetical protein
MFKRAQQVELGPKLDRRLTRTKALNSLLIGAWSGWVVQRNIPPLTPDDYFQNFVLFIIILSSIFLGVEASTRPTTHSRSHRTQGRPHTSIQIHENP